MVVVGPRHRQRLPALVEVRMRDAGVAQPVIDYLVGKHLDAL